MEQVVHAIGLSALVSIGNPIELIKSRFQTMNELIDRGTIQKKYQGIVDCIKMIKVNEGVRALWKGNSIALARFFPNQKINNDVKNKVKTFLPDSAISNVLSGVIGGWAAAAILFPIDTARIFISTSNKRAFETVKDLIKNIKLHGVNFLYRGYASSLLNIALFRGTFFGMFDTLKNFADNQNQKWLAAYTSGLTAGLIVYPIQTLRKKMIVGRKRQSGWETVCQIFKNQGIQGFYRGCILTPFQSLCGAIVLMYFDSMHQKQQ